MEKAELFSGFKQIAFNLSDDLFDKTKSTPLPKQELIKKASLKRRRPDFQDELDYKAKRKKEHPVRKPKQKNAQAGNS